MSEWVFDGMRRGGEEVVRQRGQGVFFPSSEVLHKLMPRGWHWFVKNVKAEENCLGG